MNKKKVLLSVVALLLVCALSVAGTLAFLNNTTGALKNTFIASATPDNFVAEFNLKEYGVDADNKGGYTKDNTDVIAAAAGEEKGNSYNMVPGLEIPKEVFVELKRDNATPAYLFVEVVAEDMTDYIYSVDTTKWVALSGVTGANGGAVYVYGADNAATPIGKVETAQNYTILTGNKVTANATLTQSQGTLTFYAYIAQATVSVDGANTNDAAAVYNACF